MVAREDDILKELTTIRKLLIVGLLQSGLTQGQLAAVLGVHRTMIGKMFPAGAMAEVSKKPKASKVKAESNDE